jgi:hypothetical protein
MFYVARICSQDDGLLVATPIRVVDVFRSKRSRSSDADGSLDGARSSSLVPPEQRLEVGELADDQDLLPALADRRGELRVAASPVSVQSGDDRRAAAAG